MSAPTLDAGPGAAPPVEGRWRRVVAGQSVSLAGAYAQQVVLGYLALRAAGPIGVAAVTGCRYLPTLAAPKVGRWVDGRARRVLLRRAAVVQMLLCAAFAAVVAAGETPLWALCAYAAVYAVGATLDAVCATPVLVDRCGGRAREVVARMSVGSSLARVGGAAAAGLLTAVAGPAAPLALNSVSFLALYAALSPDPCDHDGDSRAASPPAASRWWTVDGLWPVTVGFVVFAATAFQPAVLWPTLGDRLLGGAGGIAQLTSVAAVGTLVGGVAAVRSTSRGWRPAAAGYLVCAAGLATLAACRPGDRPVAWLGAATFGVGAAWALAKVSGSFAAALAPELRSHAQGWYRLLLDGTGPAGGLAVGAVCAAATPAVGAWACASMATLAAVVSAVASRRPAH